MSSASRPYAFRIESRTVALLEFVQHDVLHVEQYQMLRETFLLLI